MSARLPDSPAAYPHPHHTQRAPRWLAPACALLALCGMSSAQADVTMQSWANAPFGLTSGNTSFAGTVSDPALNGGTSATFTFSNPTIGVNVNNPSSPNFAGSVTSYFGLEPSGFGVGNSTVGRWERGESFTMQATHAFQLSSIKWRENSSDEVVHISWTSGGIPMDSVVNIVGNLTTFGTSITADANTPVVFTNVSAINASLSGRLRIENVIVALVAQSSGSVEGSVFPFLNWHLYPWNFVSGGTSINGTYKAPENGGIPVAFSFANPKLAVNVDDPYAPNFSSAVNSYFGLEPTGFGVGNTALGRFERKESFTLQADHRFSLKKIRFAEYHGDEVLHLRWTSGGVVYEEVVNVDDPFLAFDNVQPDANTQLQITNVSPTTAYGAGRLRIMHAFVALVFNTAPTYDHSGPDGFIPMRGVNIGGGEFGDNVPGIENSDYIYPIAAQMDYYASKNQMLIRMPFKWRRVQASLYGSLKPSDMSTIDGVMNMAEERGMKVILDMHDYGKRTGSLIGSSAVPNAAFKDVWRRIADRYKNHPALYAYGIMNEPTGTGGYWPAAAQAAVDGIREVDSNNFVLVSGVGYSTASSFQTANANLNVIDPTGKLAYEAHCYFSHANNDNYSAYDSQTEKAYPEKSLILVAPFINFLQERNARGFVGEYGVPNTDVRWNGLLEEFLKFLTANGVSGTYWSGGLWYGNYHLSCEPTNNYTVDRQPMAVMVNYP